MTSDKIFLTLEQAVALLLEGDEIHTFRNPAPGVLIGADWTRARILEVLAAAPCIEVTGGDAQASGHGIAIEDALGPLFIQASRFTPSTT